MMSWNYSGILSPSPACHLPVIDQLAVASWWSQANQTVGLGYLLEQEGYAQEPHHSNGWDSG